MPQKPENISEYIATFPAETQKVLKQIRATIKKTAPDAEEGISYGIPTFYMNGKYLIYFAGYKSHIGIYPVPRNNPTFDKAFANYKTSGKGTVQFPLDEPMPLALLEKIVTFRIKEEKQKQKQKQKEKQKQKSSNVKSKK